MSSITPRSFNRADCRRRASARFSFPEPLLIDEQGETLLEAKLTGIGRLDLRAERVRHSVQLHGV